MKSIIRLAFLFAITFSFATNFENTKNFELTKYSFSQDKNHYLENMIADECSVTASGTVEMASGGSFIATITVSGPCDASLADKLRSAIKGLRDSFK